MKSNVIVNGPLMNAIAGIHYGFCVVGFKKRLMWFLCWDQRQITQCAVSHFALVCCKSILSWSSWNLIWKSHMPERCQNKLRSVRNLRGKYRWIIVWDAKREKLRHPTSHCNNFLQFTTIDISCLQYLKSKYLGHPKIKISLKWCLSELLDSWTLFMNANVSTLI